VPEIDHRVREGLERVVHPADALEAQQQPAELVLPSKHPLDRTEALFEDGRLEDRLAAPLGLLSAARIGVNVGTSTLTTIDPALLIGIAPLTCFLPTVSVNVGVVVIE
jgi:hypothetical protein